MKSKSILGQVVISVLALLTVISIVFAFKYSSDIAELGITTLCACLFVMQIYYLVGDYKTPHGNIFRISVVLYSWVFLFLCFKTVNSYYEAIPVSVYLMGISALTVSYVSGRLNKLYSCSVLMAIVVCLNIADIIYTKNTLNISGFEILAYSFVCIEWLETIAIYNFRYKGHLSK